ncbi:hypothetical protein EJB05_22959, partial [Eragrostis curvula]
MPPLPGSSPMAGRPWRQLHQIQPSAMRIPEESLHGATHGSSSRSAERQGLGRGIKGSSYLSLAASLEYTMIKITEEPE